MKRKIAIVTNILAPYRVPLFNEIAARPDVDLRVFLCARSEPNRHWKWPDDIRFEYVVHTTFKWSRSPQKTVYMNPGLVVLLLRFKPDVVIVGSIGLLGLAALAGARLSGARLILWHEGNLHTERNRSKLVVAVRKFLIARARAYVGVSSAAASYFEHLGADPNRVTVSLQTLDVKSFRREVENHRAEKDALKRELGSKGPILSYFGNLESVKGPDLLLESYLRLVQLAPEAELLIVGAGSMREMLAEKAAGVKVHFLGFKQHDELPALYAITDVFCLFSRSETFGVVIAEAVASGVPIICSKYAGAATDLVEDGRNGYVVDPEDSERAATLISNILSDARLKQEMANHSTRMAEKCTIEDAANAMLKAVDISLNST